jgi:hypothetical protein
MKRFLVGCMLVALSPLAVASEDGGEFYVAPRVGLGKMRVEAFSGVNEFTEHVDTVDIGVSGGYMRAIGVSVEIGFDSQQSANLFGAFDEFKLYEEFALLGYRLPLSDQVQLTAKLGCGRWTLQSQEGVLLNPGPEKVTEISGYETIWEVEVTHQVNSYLSLGGAFKQATFDFGRASSIAFVARFNF